MRGNSDLEKREAESIIRLLREHLPELTCDIEERLDGDELILHIWILANPGYRPNLKQFLRNHGFEHWGSGMWLNSDQRAELCSITKIDK